MRELVEREVLCVRCKGTGKVRHPVDVQFAVITFGLTLLAEKITCPKCGGTGKQWMRERIIKQEKS